MRSALSFLRRHQLVRLFLTNAAIGFSASGIFIGALFGFNVGGIARLIATQHAWPFMLLLWFFAGLTFASVQMGVAVMNLRDGPPPAGGKRQRVQGGARAAVPVQRR